jgi:hypothetical protein
MEKNFVAFLFFIFSFNLLAQTLGKDEIQKKKYIDFINIQTTELQTFKDKLMNGSLCPGFNISCFKEELKKTNINSSTHLVLNTAIIGAFIAKAKESKKGQCDINCRTSYLVEYLDLNTDYISRFDIKKLFSYTDLPIENSEAQVLRAKEDITIYNLFQLMSDKLITLYSSIDPKNISDLNLLRKLHLISINLMKISKINWFLQGELAASSGDMRKILIFANVTPEKENKAQFEKDLNDFGDFFEDINREKKKIPSSTK